MRKMLDNYPSSVTLCFKEGITGNCGFNCHVFQKGECKEPEEVIKCHKNEIEADTVSEYLILYGLDGGLI